MTEDDKRPATSTEAANTSASWAGAFTFTVLGQVVQGAARLGFLVLLGRYAGKETLGEVSALLAIGTLLALCWPQPAGAAASKYVAIARASAGPSDREAIESFTSRTVLIASAPLAIVAAVWAVWWVGVPWSLTLSAALFSLCLGLYTYVRGVRNGRLRFRAGFLWDCAGASATLIVMAGILWSGRFEYALLALSAGYLVSALPGWPKSLTRSPSRAHRREIRRFTAWTSVQVIAAGGLLPAVTALAALYANPSALGDFGAAVSIATPVLLLAIALRTSTAPFVAHQVAIGDDEGSRTATDSLLRATVTFVIPIVGVTCIWSQELLDLLYSHRFTSGSTLLVILLLGVSLNCFGASHVWLSSGPAWGARTLALCNGAGFAVGITTAVLAQSNLPGASAAAVGYLIGSLTSAGAATHVVWRRGEMRWLPVVARLIVGYALIMGSLAATQHSGALTRLTATFILLVILAILNSRDTRRLIDSAPWSLRQAL